MPTASSDDSHDYDDLQNQAGLRVTREGGCLRLSLINFEGNPLRAEVIVPAGSSKAALAKFFSLFVANVDVYANLLEAYEREHGGTPRVVKRKKAAHGSRLTEVVE
jgi:hypothetical protein